MSRFWIRTLVALTAFLVVVSLASAQRWAGKGRLQGQIKNEEGEFIEGATVTLRHVDSPDEGPDPLTTDKKGRWAYLGLAGGRWTILIDADGYLGSEGSANVIEGAFGPGETIRVELRPIPEEVQREAEGARIVAWIESGNTLLDAQKYAEARAEYERALEKLEESDKPVVLRGIARTYYQEGSVEEAIATLKQALAIEPDDPGALELLVTLLVNEGREEEAQTYMAQLPQESKLDPNTLLNLGIKRYNDGNLEEALEYFDRTVSENPAMATAYYYRGLVHLAQENAEAAAADLSKLLELEPEHPKAAEAKQFLEYLQPQQ
ncbi:MAG: tetratricopeptide repeat protein [bacterium]|nr:tetratricopeptide repeat protein [bacterium]